jgi:hypothetical protein
MSNPVSRFMIPPVAQAPRGARWTAPLLAGAAEAWRALAKLSAQAAAGARRAGSALWRELETMGQARAQRELQLLARRSEGLDRVRQAAAVREFASGHIEVDPRFAAELFAVADRHEQGQSSKNGVPHTAATHKLAQGTARR